MCGLHHIIILLHYDINLDQPSKKMFLHYRMGLSREMSLAEFLFFRPELDTSVLYDSVFNLHPEIIDYLLNLTQYKDTNVGFYLYHLYLSYHDDDYHYDIQRLKRTIMTLLSHNPDLEVIYPITRKIPNPPTATLATILSTKL